MNASDDTAYQAPQPQQRTANKEQQGEGGHKEARFMEKALRVDIAELVGNDEYHHRGKHEYER